MKSIAVLLLIGAITVDDVAAIKKHHHHHHHSEYAQLANLMAKKHEFGSEKKETVKISNKEHNEF